MKRTLGFARPSLRARRPDLGLEPARPRRRTLRIYLIKPSRYDDDGHVLRFRWGVIPNNTLTALAGLTDAYAAARSEVDVQTVLWDELVDGLLDDRLIASIPARAEADGVEPIIALAGVQSNQYPRARDIALRFRRLGLPVIMGGFHVSSHAPTRAFLESVGVSCVIGEADVTWAQALDDHCAGAFRARYQPTDGIRAKTGLNDILVPRIEEAPLPRIDERYLRRFFNPTFSTLDTSRGCPFTCSYCSVKNVMGRTMRSRAPERAVEWLRHAYDEHGIRNLLVVDDDFFRSPSWEAILGGWADLRRTRPDIGIIFQTDVEAGAHGVEGSGDDPLQRRSRRFVELAAAAGCFEVFIGLESFEPANLEQVQKFHNEERQDRHAATDADAVRERVRSRYRRVVDAWHAAGIGVHCGYIIGLPFDDVGCGRAAARDLTDIGIDIASFFVYTPFPGTEDFEGAVADGGLLSHDLNQYDSTHSVMRHPRLSPAQIEAEYADAYRHFYRLRRVAWSLATFHAVPGLGTAARAGMMTQQIYFTYATRRGWHPMMGGIWRVRDRGECRRVVSDADAARLYLGLPS